MSRVLRCLDCGFTEDMLHLPLLVPERAEPVSLCRGCCAKRWASSSTASWDGGDRLVVPKGQGWRPRAGAVSVSMVVALS